MRQLLPVAADVDPEAVYGDDERPAPAGRPWVVANMVASVDGAAAVDGRTASLGGPADKAVFAAIRGVADVIVAAAGTVRAERYRPPREPSPGVARGRAARGQAPRPRLAVVSRSLDLDPELPLFGDPDQVPLVFTGGDADPGRRAALARVAEVVTVGEAGVDPAAMLAWLHEHGVRVVLTEGGPTLLGQFVALDLLDELCLTMAPTLVGGPAMRITTGPVVPTPTPLELDRILEVEGELLLRYRRSRPAG